MRQPILSNKYLQRPPTEGDLKFSYKRLLQISSGFESLERVREERERIIFGLGALSNENLCLALQMLRESKTASKQRCKMLSSESTLAGSRMRLLQSALNQYPKALLSDAVDFARKTPEEPRELEDYLTACATGDAAISDAILYLERMLDSTFRASAYSDQAQVVAIKAPLS